MIRVVLSIEQKDYIEGSVEIGNIKLEEAIEVAKMIVPLGLDVKIDYLSNNEE